MFAPITYFADDILIERRRFLPSPARILVRKGQEVSAIDPVVENTRVNKHQVLDVARGLGVSTGASHKFIICQVGDQVSEGDILAGPVGLTKRVVRSLHAGTVVYMGRGKVLLELSGSPVQKVAGLPGKIVDLVHERGAIVQVRGALIQAVWGNGKIGQGSLVVGSGDKPGELNLQAVKSAAEGNVVVGGACIDESVLQAAEEINLGGLVLGSLHPSLYEKVMQVAYPVLLIEGFGKYPINHIAGKILSAHVGEIVAVNAEPWNKFSPNRPELVIPAAISEEPSPVRKMELFAPGNLVREVGCSDLGKAGKLVELVGTTSLANGLKVDAASVQFENGELVNIPLSNLELIC